MSRPRELLILIFSLALLIGGCAKQDPRAMPTPPPPAVSVVAAVTKSVPIYLDEIGKSGAFESVTVTPQIAGRITERLFEDGAQLKKDQPLFTIDPRPYQAQLDAAQAQLAQSRAALDLANTQLKMYESIANTRAVSQMDYETKKNTVALDEAQVQAALAAVESAKLNLEYCHIHSPIDGRAGVRLVDVGNVVQANTTGLLLIQRLDPIYADFTITENDLPEVQREMSLGTLKVLVRIPSDPENGGRAGTLTFLDNSVANGTGTVHLRATMANPDRHFWPGQFVNVRLILATDKGAVLIPNQAAQLSQQGQFVYVVKPDDTAELRLVVLGQQQGSDVVVTKGLANGERVVITGQLAVRPGAKVRVQAAMPAQPGAGNPANANSPSGGPRGKGQVVNFSEPFVRRPVMTVVLTASVILFGTLAYFTLPVNDLPAVDYPVIQVSVNYPGATPETMANNVATPLERQFMQIPGLELITSNSGTGRTGFVLQFALSKSLDAAATDVQAAITQATAKLPVDLPSPPTFTKTNPNDQPIFYLGVVSDSLTEGQLYDYANTQLGERISILSGVSQVQVFGAQSAVRIKADPSAMAARNITIDDLSAAIKAGTSYTGAGQFDGEHHTFLLQPQGQLSSTTDYEHLIVGQTNGAPVFLKDIAQVKDSLQDERISMRFWARGTKVPSAMVVIAVFRRAGSNAVEVAQEVRDLIPSVRAQLPGSADIVPVYDRSRTIVNSVKDVQVTLAIAFVLVVMVIFLFLGRATDTLIPAIALPLSMLITFVAMSLLGYSLDNLSLMAMTLAIGFLVDDAIVFLENTVRLMETGQGALEATLNSAREISFTILAMTISLAAVFIPLVFMSGLVGRIFREFSITIIILIFASGVVSLTLTPLMCSRLLARRGAQVKKTWAERVIGGTERRVMKLYGQSLWFFLRHRWISALTWVICLVGTGYLFYTVPKAFLPVGDSSFIRGVLVAQEGSSPDQMHAYQNDVEEALHANPNVDMTFTVAGSGFLPANQGFLLVFLKDPSQRPPIQAVAAQLMGAINTRIPGAMAFLQPNPVLQIATGATANTQGQFAYAISGIDPNEVYAVAGKLMQRMFQYPGFLFVNSDLFNHTPNLSVELLRDQAKMYGVSETRILNLLHNAYSQNYTYLIKKPNDQYQVILEAADADRSAPEDLGLLYIKSDDGQRMVPLRAVTSWHSIVGAQSVNHINHFTSVTLFFNLKPGYTIGQATQFVEGAAKQILPPGIQGSLQGEALTFQNTVSSLAVLMVMAVFVMYVILAILYESYLHPLTVLSALPVALVGGLLTLQLFGAEASLYAFIGMFMLMGIVKKNGILIVDFAQMRVEQGQKDDVAIHEASVQRFRPIMMTTMAALMGALPLALGYGQDGSSRRPLGLVVVGGLIVSQFITLYITPAIYLYLEEFQERVLNRSTFFRSHRVHAAQPGSAPAPASND